MIMAMSLKPTPKLGVISIYKVKIHWAVAKLSYFFTLLVIEMFPKSSYMLWSHPTNDIHFL